MSSHRQVLYHSTVSLHQLFSTSLLPEGAIILKTGSTLEMEKFDDILKHLPNKNF
jgi:hypothetical protein